MTKNEHWTSEESERISAIERFENGESPKSICASLGRSKSWFYKWLERYRAGDSDWCVEYSRQPLDCAHRTPKEVEEIVKLVRLSLYNDGAFCGAQAVLWEMEERGVKPLPSVRTVGRILAKHGLTDKRTGRYEPKGKSYPALSANRANEVHQMDFVGPCYLQGGVRFYSLNSVDVATRRCAAEPATNGKTHIVQLVWDSWRRLGLPRYVQVDNETVFYGSLRHPRGMGKLIRLCLLNKVEPVFIPPAEPWRNGIVEKFNDHWLHKFFRRETMEDAEELRTCSLAFETRHNERWRYSALGGQSPIDFTAACGATLKFPDKPQPPRPPLPKPKRGRYHAVRFIRSDRTLDLFGEKFPMPPEAAYEYLQATVDVGKQTLTLRLHGQIIEQQPFKMR